MFVPRQDIQNSLTALFVAAPPLRPMTFSNHTRFSAELILSLTNEVLFRASDSHRFARS